MEGIWSTRVGRHTAAAIAGTSPANDQCMAKGHQSRLASEREARLEADARADTEHDRRVAVERLNASLAHDLARASECRLLWLRCPPRVVVGLLGLGTGAALTVAATGR